MTPSMLAGYAKVIALAAVAVSAAFLISIFAIPLFSSPPITIGSGGADARRLVTIIYGRNGDISGFKLVKLSDSTVQTSSMQWTLDPFGRSMRTFYEAGINSSATVEEKNAWVEGIDAQERYMLVRLPEWLGGTGNDISAYRAFSAFDIASHCVIRYWGGDRMLIQDPSQSNGYRPWDGLTVFGLSSFGGSGITTGLFSSSILGLPQMRLGVDSEGYIVAYRPDNSLYGDGVVGEGKRFTSEQLEQSNEKMIEAVSEHAGFKLPLPATILGTYLVWLVPETTDNSLFPGHSFEGYEGAFSAVYQTRPLQASHASYRITVFPDEKVVDASQAKVTFDKLFGAASPECEQGCRYVIKGSDNAIARADTEAEDDIMQQLLLGERPAARMSWWQLKE